MNLQKEIGKYVTDQLVMDGSKKSLDPEEDLLNEGVIDSMGILQLVAFLEEKYGIQVADEDIVPENFRSLNALAQFVQRKNNGQAA